MGGGHPAAPTTIILGLQQSTRQADWQLARGERATATGLDTLQEKPTTSSGIPSPINDRLIDALFIVLSRIWEIRTEMDKLADDRMETADSEEGSEDFHRFRSPTRSDHSHGDEEDREEHPAPLSVSVTRSSKRLLCSV